MHRSLRHVPGRRARLAVLSALFLQAAVAAVSSPVHAQASPSTGQTMNSTGKGFFHDAVQHALESAIRLDDAAAISAALAAGAKVDARGLHDVTPLMIAVDSQRPRAVDALLHAGADPNLLAADGAGAVGLAVDNYRTQPFGRRVMLALFKAGGSPDTRQPDRDPVIMRFIVDHDCEGIRLMKSLGANLDILDRARDPIIAKAAVGNDWDAVWCLIELGARYDYEDGSSRLPLSESLASKYPAPDSPLYSYKLKVWQLMKDKGLAVKPLRP
jgi:uncharacterized protein